MAQISDQDDSQIDAEEMARKFRLSYPRRMITQNGSLARLFAFLVTVSPTDSRRVEISMLTYSSGSLSCSIRGLRLLRARGCSDPKSLDMLDRMPIPATKNRKG